MEDPSNSVSAQIPHGCHLSNRVVTFAERSHTRRSGSNGGMPFPHPLLLLIETDFASRHHSGQKKSLGVPKIAPSDHSDSSSLDVFKYMATEVTHLSR